MGIEGGGRKENDQAVRRDRKYGCPEYVDTGASEFSLERKATGTSTEEQYTEVVHLAPAPTMMPAPSAMLS